MRKRGLIAVAAAMTLLGTAGCGGSGGSGGTPDTLTVWLMEGVKDNWPKAVEAANARFEKRHPGVTVEVRYQDWGNYLTKFEASLGGGQGPDVLEMGNTQTAKYMATGALLDITDKKATFPNSKKWLDGLEKSCTYEGKLYCVPYYAATRAVIYRTDMFDQAGIEKNPSSLRELTAAADRLMAEHADDPNFSALYFPGKHWYFAMSFVYDYGGAIATQKNGKWHGALDSPQARKALRKVKEIVTTYSAASRTGDEGEQPQAFADGGVAMMYDVAYALNVATSKEKGNPELEGELGAFAMPSHTPGKTMPAFLGGSDLAVSAGSDAPKLAMDWIRTFTSKQSMRRIVESGGVLPNAESLLNLVAKGEHGEAFAETARNTWFVPNAKNWATVEQRNVLPNMLVDILTGKATVNQATAKASRQVTEILNGG